jgi:hypothetical protein
MAVSTVELNSNLNNSEIYDQDNMQFIFSTTNAIVEGINNKLKLLKRCGFGFRNFNNFEIRALLFWHYPNNLAH